MLGYFYVGICTIALALSKPIKEATYDGKLNQNISETFTDDFQFGSFGKNLPSIVNHNDEESEKLDTKIKLITDANADNKENNTDIKTTSLQRVQRFDKIDEGIEKKNVELEGNKSVSRNLENVTNNKPDDAKPKDTIGEATNIEQTKLITDANKENNTDIKTTQLQRVQRFDKIDEAIEKKEELEGNKSEVARNLENVSNDKPDDPKPKDTIGQATNIEQTVLLDEVSTIVPVYNKQILLKRLESDIEAARKNVEIKTKQLEHIQSIVNAAQKSSKEAQNQLKILTVAVSNVQDSIIHTSQAALAADQVLAIQSSMVAKAKRKVFNLSQELDAIRIDFKATQSAARKAEAAAKIAQANVSKPYNF